MLSQLVGVAKLLVRYAREDPLVVFAFLPGPGRDRLWELAERDAWLLRIRAVTGLNEGEVRRIFGRRSSGILRLNYEGLCRGMPLSALDATEEE